MSLCGGRSELALGAQVETFWGSLARPASEHGRVVGGRKFRGGRGGRSSLDGGDDGGLDLAGHVGHFDVVVGVDDL